MTELPKLQIIFNPWARCARRGKVSLNELQRRFGDRAEILETHSLEELAQCLRALRRNPLGSLCFLGGDGTLSQGISNWFALEKDSKEKLALPPLLPVSAGTMNYVSKALGHKSPGFRGDPLASIESYLRGANSFYLKKMPTLEVRIPGHPPRWGFFLAWGVGCRILRRYYQRKVDPTAITALSEIALASLETLRESRQPRSARKLFRSRPIDLSVDGTSLGPAESYSLVVGSMRRICLGISPFAWDDGVLSLATCNLEPHRLLPHLPSLLFGAKDPGCIRSDDLTFRSGFEGLSFCIDEALTIEGEIYELDAPKEVQITKGPSVCFWTVTEHAA